MPPTIPINHYGGPRNQKNRTIRGILLFHAMVFEYRPALNTLVFQSKSPGPVAQPMKAMRLPGSKGPAKASARGEVDRSARPKFRLRAF